MVKILVIGDFHGKFPKKLKKEAKQCDFVLSTGDFTNYDKVRKIIFKNWTSKKWYKIVGIKKAKELEKQSFNSGLKILKELNSLGKKVYTIFGNLDFYKDHLTSEPDSIRPGFFNDKIKKLKNIVLIDKKRINVNGIEIIGHGGYVDVTDFIKHPLDKDKKDQKRRLKRYLRDEAKLNKLFFKNKPKSGFIFLIHYTPYKIFDRVKLKASPMYGKNVGWEPYNEVIKKYEPSLVLCGHMHEYQGVKKLGKSRIVAVGPAFEGKAAVIKIDDKSGKIGKIKFIK